FSGTEYLSYNYDQLRIAVQKKFGTGKNKWEEGLGLSVLTAKYGSSLQMDQGTLFTEQNGEYLDATYDFTYFIADKSNHGRFQVDGVGFSFDEYLSWISSNNKSRIILFANDIGFIGW